jgi:predicted nucleotidyltransferase
MRISHEDVTLIKDVIFKYIDDATVILFGSRVDDNKKGGDIDLLIKTKKSVTLQEKIKMLTEMELKGILRKVDLLIKTPLSKEQSIFKTAEKEGIIL